MTDMDETDAPHDLSGTVDDWMRQLADAVPARRQSPQWLLRQLERALAAWAADETRLDVEDEARIDY